LEAHRLFGHIAPSTAKRLLTKGFVTGIELDSSGDEPTFCESCIYAKSRHQKIPKVREGDCVTSFGEEIHSDVWGPSPVESLGGRCFFVTFTDDHSRHSHLYLLQKKSVTFPAYKNFEAWCKTQLDTSIKCLHSDHGGEYMSNAFKKHLADARTKQKLTVHDTPKENGVSEWLNGVLIEHVRALLHASGLPKFLWGEAIHHIIWLKNRTSTKAVLGKTPYEVVTRKKPDLMELHEWGCHVWVHDNSTSKLDGRAHKGRWMNFDDQSKGSQIYWPDKHNVTVKRSVIFTTPIVVVDGLEAEDSAKPNTSVKSPSAPELLNISDNTQTEVSPAPTATHIPDSANSKTDSIHT
jgi:hypothetical protein